MNHSSRKCFSVKKGPSCSFLPTWYIRSTLKLQSNDGYLPTTSRNVFKFMVLKNHSGCGCGCVCVKLLACVYVLYIKITVYINIYLCMYIYVCWNNTQILHLPNCTYYILFYIMKGTMVKHILDLSIIIASKFSTLPAKMFGTHSANGPWDKGLP